MQGVKICGLGKALPDFTVTNDELAKFLDTSDEWIMARTGIRERRISKGETTTFLATQAAKEAIADGKIEPGLLDYIIVATVSPDYTMPSTACMVQGAIGASNATCFDITAACSGFIYASEIAVNFIRCGVAKNVLVIGAEVLSKGLDWEDRRTCVLFGDGAGAAIYTASEEEKVLKIVTASDGSRAMNLTLPALPISHYFYQSEMKSLTLDMDGHEVYKFALTEVPKSIKQVVNESGYKVEDIDRFILHQANERIIDSVANKLKVDTEKFFKNIASYGNTSAATIPIAMTEAKHLFKPGDKIVLSGFGAGLTWGSMLLVW